MNDREMVIQLYQLILGREEERYMEICLSRAKKLGEKIFSLTSSQLSGLADLAIGAENIGLKKLLDEISTRNKMRWKKEEIITMIDGDFRVLREKANTAIADSNESLKIVLNIPTQPPDLPIETQRTQFQLRLFQIYLIAAVEFARVKQTEGRK